jgi:hypothetical protein
VRVDWAIPCRYAEVQQGAGATIVGAGADVAIVPDPPAVVQLLFAVRYVGPPDELDGETEHPVACRIFNPKGDRIGEQRGGLRAEGTPLVAGYATELIVPTTIVLEAQEHGTYAFEFSIDDHEIQVPIHIIEPPQQ